MKPALFYPRNRRFIPLNLFAALLLGCTALIAFAVLFDAPASAQFSNDRSPEVTSVKLKPTGLEISWSPPADLQEVEVYVIRRAHNINGAVETIVDDLDGSTTKYLDTLSGVPAKHLISPIFWSYQVRAKFRVLKLVPNESAFGPWSDLYTVSVSLPKPGGPTKWESLGPVSYTFTMSWTAPSLSWSDQGIGVTGYNVYRVKETIVHTRNAPPGPVNVQVIAAETDADTLSYTEHWNYIELIGTGQRHLFSVRAKYGIFLSQETGTVQIPD